MKRTDAGFTFAGQGTGEAIPLALIAATHEFGSPEHNIPERPVLRQGATHAMQKLGGVVRSGLRAVLAGTKTIDQVSDLLGVLAVGEVKREFTSPSPAFVPNKPQTIARKGSSRPLIDTGQYRQSIAHQVERGVPLNSRSANAR